jgi:hypothetical protein
VRRGGVVVAPAHPRAVVAARRRRATLPRRRSSWRCDPGKRGCVDWSFFYGATAGLPWAAPCRPGGRSRRLPGLPPERDYIQPVGHVNANRQRPIALTCLHEGTSSTLPGFPCHLLQFFVRNADPSSGPASLASRKSPIRRAFPPFIGAPDLSGRGKAPRLPHSLWLRICRLCRSGRGQRRQRPSRLGRLCGSFRSGKVRKARRTGERPRVGRAPRIEWPGRR